MKLDCENVHFPSMHISNSKNDHGSGARSAPTRTSGRNRDCGRYGVRTCRSSTDCHHLATPPWVAPGAKPCTISRDRPDAYCPVTPDTLGRPIVASRPARNERSLQSFEPPPCRRRRHAHHLPFGAPSDCRYMHFGRTRVVALLEAAAGAPQSSPPFFGPLHTGTDPSWTTVGERNDPGENEPAAPGPGVVTSLSRTGLS